MTGNPITSPPDPGSPRAGPEEPLFLRPYFLSLTIGIPFCIYKLLFGVAMIRVASGTSPYLAAAGYFVLLWAGVDLAMNAVRGLLDASGRPLAIECCTLAQAGYYVHAPRVFLAVDTLLSFSIICFMLWSAWIALLTPFESVLWYAGTTLNLISISLVSLYSEVRKVRA